MRTQVRLDHHLLGNLHAEGTEGGDVASAGLEPCYFPVLNESLVTGTLQAEERISRGLDKVVKEQLQDKLSRTLTTFFQPLLTSFRQGTHK